MSAKTVIWSTLSAAVLATILAGATLAAGPGGPPGGPGAPGAGAPPMGGRAGRGGGAPASLGQAMQDMGRMITAIKTNSADDTKIEDAIKSIIQMERDVAIAKMQMPPVDKVDANKKATAAADFRTAMSTLQRTLLDLEDAVAAKKADDVKKLIQKLEDTEKAGHTEFKVGA